MKHIIWSIFALLKKVWLFMKPKSKSKKEKLAVTTSVLQLNGVL